MVTPTSGNNSVTPTNTQIPSTVPASATKKVKISPLILAFQDVLSVSKTPFKLPPIKSPPTIPAPSAKATVYNAQKDDLRSTWAQLSTAANSYVSIVNQLKTSLAPVTQAVATDTKAVADYKTQLLSSLTSTSKTISDSLTIFNKATDLNAALKSVEDMKTALLSSVSLIQSSILPADKMQQYLSLTAQMNQMKVNSAAVVASYFSPTPTTGATDNWTSIQSQVSSYNSRIDSASASLLTNANGYATQAFQTLANTVSNNPPNSALPANYVGPTQGVDYIETNTSIYNLNVTMKTNVGGSLMTFAEPMRSASLVMGPPVGVITATPVNTSTIIYKSAAYTSLENQLNAITSDPAFLFSSNLSASLSNVLSLSQTAGNLAATIATTIAKNPAVFQSKINTSSQTTTQMNQILTQYQSALTSIQGLSSYSASSSLQKLVKDTQTLLNTTKNSPLINGKINSNFQTLALNMSNIASQAFPSLSTTLVQDQANLNQLANNLINLAKDPSQTTLSGRLDTSIGANSQVSALNNPQNWKSYTSANTSPIQATFVGTSYKLPSNALKAATTAYNNALTAFNAKYSAEQRNNYNTYSAAISSVNQLLTSIGSEFSGLNTFNTALGISNVSPTMNLVSTASSLDSLTTTVNTLQKNLSISFIIPPGSA